MTQIVVGLFSGLIVLAVLAFGFAMIEAVTFIIIFGFALGTWAWAHLFCWIAAELIASGRGR